MLKDKCVGTINYAYTSREWEREIGDYYYRDRHFDPKVGRFLSEDRIGFQGGDENLYRYVLNNPIMRTDPNGTSVGKAVLWGVIIGAGAIIRQCNKNQQPKLDEQERESDARDQRKRECEQSNEAIDRFCATPENSSSALCLQPKPSC